MKLFLVIASTLLLASPAIGEKTMISRMRSRSLESESFENSNSLISNQIRQPFNLPEWVTMTYPEAADILAYTKNVIAEIPAKTAAVDINNLCNFAKFYGILKPAYVPLGYKINLHLYGPNSISEYSLSGVRSLVNDPKFDQKKNVTIFISSWREDESDPEGVVASLASAYVNKGTHNFIVVNVADLVDTFYKWAVLDSRQTGRLIGEGLMYLNDYLPVDRIHIIGHGLGAHIAGAIGRYIHGYIGQQIGRITALDPSTICSDGALSLQRGDAAFVDVIHSNNGVLGQSQPIGDADFYPNGPGVLPPGCVDVICAHNRAVRFYTESVRDGSENNFMAVQCTSLDDMQNNKCQSPKIPMGLKTPSYARGSYYLQTKSRPPYGEDATGHYQA